VTPLIQKPAWSAQSRATSRSSTPAAAAGGAAITAPVQGLARQQHNCNAIIAGLSCPHRTIRSGLSNEAHDTDTAARQLGPRREEFDAAPICSASASSCTLCAASTLQHSSTPALMSPLSLGGSVTIRQFSCGITSSGREAWMQRRSSRPRSPRWRRVLSNHKGQCPHVVLKFSLRSNST
jgi:hypothetical protein